MKRQERNIKLEKKFKSELKYQFTNNISPLITGEKMFWQINVFKDSTTKKKLEKEDMSP